MKFTIPAIVVDPAAEATVSVLTRLERRIYWTIDTRTLSSMPDDRIALDKWYVKRDDIERVAVRFLDDIDSDTTTKFKLPQGCALRFRAIEKDDFGGPVLADAEFALYAGEDADAADPKYIGLIAWDSAAINEAMSYLEAAEDPYLDVFGEFEVVQTDSGVVIARFSSGTISIRIENDVNRDQDAPTAGSLLRNGYQWRWDIESEADLAAFATTSLIAGRPLVEWMENGQGRKDVLVAGTAANNPGWTKRPTDYDADDNAKYWKRIS